MAGEETVMLQLGCHVALDVRMGCNGVEGPADGRSGGLEACSQGSSCVMALLVVASLQILVPS